jgi:hypothetical protein
LVYNVCALVGLKSFMIVFFFSFCNCDHVGFNVRPLLIFVYSLIFETARALLPVAKLE